MRWQCIPPNDGLTIPVSFNANGEIICMSQDGTNCLWKTPAECEVLAAQPIANLAATPKCSPDSSKLYNPDHWCFSASQMLLPPLTSRSELPVRVWLGQPTRHPAETSRLKMQTATQPKGHCLMADSS